MSQFEKETLDRLRRIETRLSRYLANNGFDLEGEKPRYDVRLGLLYVPSRKVPLDDCLTAIASADRGTTVMVVLGSEIIASIVKE